MKQRENQALSQANLPENLRQKFVALEKRLWKIETATAVCAVLGGFSVAFVVLFVSDRIWDSPQWLRLSLAAGSLAILTLTAVWWLNRWVFRRRDLRALAQLVQRKFSRLGDRLLGIVELSSERHHDANFSPELYRAAIEQVSNDAAPFDFKQAVESRRAKRFCGAAIAIAAMALFFCALAPAAGVNVLQRWLAPTARIERFTFVQIAALPDKMIVPHGEPFSVSATVTYRSFWKPSRLTAKLPPQIIIHAKSGDGRINFSVPGQLQAATLLVKLGDAQKSVVIEPTHRPALRDLNATVQLPDYLQQPPQQQIVPGGVLAVLEGSTISLNGKANRNLRQAFITLDDTNSTALKVERDAFRSEFLKRDGLFKITLSFHDDLGLSNSPAMRLVVQSKPDSAPTPQFVDVSRDVAMLHTDVLELKTAAQDDFGVRSIGLSWETSTSAEHHDSFGVREVRKELTARDEKKVERNFSWSPAAFRIAPDSMVELSAWAKDFFPERERVFSQPIRIFVMGNEKHAEFVRQRLDSVFARLEEVSRLEEKIAQSTEALLASTNLPAEKIASAANDQQRNAEQLEQLAKEGVRTMQEAMKNPLLPEQVFADWSKNLQAMEQVAKQMMKPAAQSLQAAKQNSSPQNADQRKEKLSDAKQKEEEALAALGKLQEQINKNLDDLQALTLSHRLRQVATTETEIEGALQKNISETIGLLPRELPEPLRQTNTALATVQTNLQSEAGNLHKEISRFYERTKKQNYGDVSDEMAEQRAVDGLDHVRSLILDNVTMEASRNSAVWAVKFNDWAGKLEPKEYCEGGGEGQGEGKKQADMTKVLVALLKLRQAEMNVRGQTSLLDEQRESKGYVQATKDLLSTQKKLTSDFHTLLVENVFEQLDESFSQTQKAMREAETLLAKPQTDDKTIAAQTRAVDHLSDLINLINEQAKRSNKSNPDSNESESAEDMAMLMQMGKGEAVGQGMPSEKSGGGNTSGGSTDRTPGAPAGDASGKSATERKIARASGAAKNAPVEFRDALENYFKAVEKSE